jgi:hypothetical protein
MALGGSMKRFLAAAISADTWFVSMKSLSCIDLNSLLTLVSISGIVSAKTAEDRASNKLNESKMRE